MNRLCHSLQLHCRLFSCNRTALTIVGKKSPILYSKMPFYAVAKGHSPGIYTVWKECEEQIKGFKGPQFKKFETKEEAEEFIQQRCGNVVDKRNKADSTKKDKNDDAPSTENKAKKRSHSSDADDDEGSPVKKKVMEYKPTDKDGFRLDEDGRVIVYTDGCCEMNGRHGAKAGIGVFFGDGNPHNVSEPVKGRATNNTGEIQAITHAFKIVKEKGFNSVIINTDSQFVINCMTSWLGGWKKRGWKKSDGTPVKNKEDLIDCDEASDGLMVKYNHVKGHSGVHGNEMADQLAKSGSKRYVAPDEST